MISGSIEESEEDGTLPDRKTTFSKIRFRPNSADNQVTYACEASHPALRGTPTKPASPMRSSVLLSVLCKLLKMFIVGWSHIYANQIVLPRITLNSLKFMYYRSAREAGDSRLYWGWNNKNGAGCYTCMWVLWGQSLSSHCLVQKQPKNWSQLHHIRINIQEHHHVPCSTRW